MQNLLFTIKSSAVAEMGDVACQNKLGGKIRVANMLCPIRWGSHVRQCRLGGRGLPPYQLASWSIQPFGHN